jgi:hypothetical protein
VRSVIRTRRARGDLAAVHSFIAQDSPDFAAVSAGERRETSVLSRVSIRSGRAGERLAYSAAMDAAAPRLNLQAYRRLLRNQLVPTRIQRESFPFYVAKAHSWYKRIPPLSPGEPFVFFLDPRAGFDRVPQPADSWTTAVREQKGFHHAAIPTAQYRDRFGNLAFACAQSMRAGTFASGPLRIETGFGACVIDELGALRRLPEEVEAGAVRLTSRHPSLLQPAVRLVALRGTTGRRRHLARGIRR